jgi:hypothetical protein
MKRLGERTVDAADDDGEQHIESTSRATAEGIEVEEVHGIAQPVLNQHAPGVTHG